MMRVIVLGAGLALGPSISAAYVGDAPAMSLLEQLPRAKASFTCMQLLTDGARARAAEAEIKKANLAAARAKRAAAKAAKKAAEAAQKAREEAIAAGLPPPEPPPAEVAPPPAPVSTEADRFHEGKVVVTLDPSGLPIQKHKVIERLAVPREQIDRVVRPTRDTFAKRIVRRFKALIYDDYLRAPDEMTLLVKDVRARDLTPVARLAMEQVGRRLAEHAAEAIEPTGKHYLMRHVLKGRRAIVDHVKNLAAKASLNEATLLMHLDEQAEARAARRAAVDAPAEVEVPYRPPFGIAIPGFTTENAALMWKAVGFGAVAAGAFVALFTPDPKIMLPLFLIGSGGLSFFSATVRSEVSGLIARVRAILQQRRDQRELVVAAERLAQRHQRNLIQIQTLNQIAKRLEGNEKEYGFAYYSYMAEVPRTARADGVVDVTTDPFAEPRLVRVEHVVYTDEVHHYLLTFVTDADGATVEMTNVALAAGA